MSSDSASNDAGDAAPLKTVNGCLRVLREVCLTYRVDASGRFSHVSEAVQNLLGFAPADLMGQEFCKSFDRDHPALKDLAAFSKEHSSEKGIRTSLSAARRSDGTTAFMELRERCLYDEANNIIGREGLAYDVSVYITAHLALRESERKYRRLVEELGEDYVIYTHKPSGEITYMSPSIHRVLGIPADDIIGKNWRDLIGDNFVGRERAEQVRSDVKAGVRFHKFNVEVADALGGRRLVEVQQRPVFSPEGQYISMEGIAKDVTEFHRNAMELQNLKDELEERVAERTAELVAINERLVESESRYRDVVEDQTEFICRWQPGGKYTFVNEAYCRYMKKPYGEMIGQSFLQNVAVEDRPRLAAEIAGLTPKQPTAEMEHRVVHADGSIAWNHWTIRAIFDDSQRLKGYQSVGRDVTELKIVEELVLEREEHLKRVSRLAIMGELIAGIAHEIHQPLHAAQLFAEAARRNLESGSKTGIATAIDCTREISSAVTRTATIIRHLRSFSTNNPTKPEPLDINEVVREVADVMSYETRRAGVKLGFELAGQLPSWSGDRVQIQQILVHLLGNAYEAKPSKEVNDWEVVIRTKKLPEAILVEIADNGIGTELGEVDRLFDAFYTTKPQGLGMGLSICKTIAESMRAEVLARKNPDRGMTFTLRLPLSSRHES